MCKIVSLDVDVMVVVVIVLAILTAKLNYSAFLQLNN